MNLGRGFHRTAICWWLQQSCRIEPLRWITCDDGAGEIWVRKGPDRISRISVIGRVVAELRCDRKTGLQCDDAVRRPSPDKTVGQTRQIIREGFAAPKGQLVNSTDDADVCGVVRRRPPIGT